MAISALTTFSMCIQFIQVLTISDELAAFTFTIGMSVRALSSHVHALLPQYSAAVWHVSVHARICICTNHEIADAVDILYTAMCRACYICT
jgi:hypothetical protein